MAVILEQSEQVAALSLVIAEVRKELAIQMEAAANFKQQVTNAYGTFAKKLGIESVTYNAIVAALDAQNLRISELESQLAAASAED